MHRNTLPNTWFRAYTSLGARRTIDSVDDGKQLQEMGGFVKGESRTIERRSIFLLRFARSLPASCISCCSLYMIAFRTRPRSRL